jgi:hypothetical protein
VGKQRVCVNHILRPEHDFPSLRGSNEGNCKVCIPDEENNKYCCRYIQAIAYFEDIEE